MTEIRNERLRTLKAKAEAAGRRFEEGKNRLYRDGKPLFSGEVHREEMEKLARERNSELFAIEEEVREIAAGAGAARERLENADPAELLTDEELARANARRPFALDAAASMSVADLKRRLESVLAGGDRANIFAHLVAGQSRRAEILRRQGERAASRAGTPAAAAPPAIAFTPLDETLEALKKALGGEEREAELQTAASVGAECFEVESVSNRLRFGGRSFAEVHAVQGYAVPGPRPEAAREDAREVERLARIR